MAVQIPKQVMIDKAYGELQVCMAKIQSDNQLYDVDMEMLLYKALAFVKTNKEDVYSRQVLQLANELVAQKEAKHDEPNDKS